MKKAHLNIYSILAYILLGLWCDVLYASEVYVQQSPLTIDDQTRTYYVSPITYYFEDTSAQLNLAAVRSFFPDKFSTYEVGKGAKHFGSSDSAFWSALILKNPSDKPQRILLEINNPIIDVVEFYLPQASAYKKITTGNAYYFETRPVKSNYFAVKSWLPANSEQVYFVRTISDRRAYFPITIYTGQAYVLETFHRQLIAGIFVGIIIGLTGFNFFIYLNIRFPVHFYYLFFSIMTAATILMRQNYLYGFWPHSPQWNMQAYGVIPMTWAVFFLCFFRAYFATAHYFPRIDKISLAVIVLIITFMFWPIEANYELFVLLFQIPVSTFAIAMLYVAIKRMLGGFRPAKWFLMGMMMPLITIITLTLTSMGALPAYGPIDLIANYMEVLELILFSLGIAEIIKVMANETRESDKRAHLEMRANKSMTRFLEKMSYQIRTPMNAVIGGAELLKSEALKDQEKRYVDMIESSGFALLTIIDDIIDFNAGNLQKIKLDPSGFALNQLLEESANSFSLIAKERDIEFRYELNATKDLSVYTDPVRLRQIIVNLLGNAFKFTQQGSVTLRSERLPVQKAQEADCFRFSIIDTGVGIGAEKRDRLFESYVQADKSTARKYGGTGLGLSISKQLVDLMEGEIGVESELDQGTTFWFTTQFPIIANQGNEVKPKTTKHEWPSIWRVLVVDDNTSNLLVLTALLEKLGLNVQSVHNGLEAVEFYRNSPSEIDMIFMDCQMPGLDGFAAAEEIREYESAVLIPPKPIIAVSAHVTTELKKEVLSSGMDGFLSKPILMSKLTEMLELADQVNKKNRHKYEN